VPLGPEPLRELAEIPRRRAVGDGQRARSGRRLQHLLQLGAELGDKVGGLLAPGQHGTVLPDDPEGRAQVRRHLLPIEVTRGNEHAGYGAHGPGEHAEQGAISRAGLGHELPGMVGHGQELAAEVLVERAQEGYDEFLPQARDLPFQSLLGQTVHLRQGMSAQTPSSSAPGSQL